MTEISINGFDFECPICKAVPPAKVFQCKEGHIICEDCLSKIQAQATTDGKEPKCSSCMAIVTNDAVTRCRVFETIVDHLRQDCQHAKLGCPKKLKPTAVRDHEAACSYAMDVSLCKYFGFEDCTFILNVANADKAEAHLLDVHNFAETVPHETTYSFVWTEHMKRKTDAVVLELTDDGSKVLLLITVTDEHISFSCVDVFRCVSSTNELSVYISIGNTKNKYRRFSMFLQVLPHIDSWEWFQNKQIEIKHNTFKQISDGGIGKVCGSASIHKRSKS